MSPALAPSRSVSCPASSLRESWAVRAASLWERAAGRTLPASQASSASPESVVRDRRAAWIRALGDDPTRLSRRRAVGSLRTTPLSRLLAPAARWIGRPLPAWTELLQTATQEAPRLAPDAAAGSLVDSARAPDDGPPIPYHDLLMPFLRIAQRRLRARIGAWDDWHPDARAGLDRALLQRLSQVSRYVFQVKFSAHRAFHGGGTSGTDRYRQFVAAHLDDGLDTVFDDYPVLGRLMAERTRDWIDATAELVLRVRRDRRRIAETLLGDPPPGSVVQVDAACSDPHRHGRGVALLTFACGRRLVYKPRSLAPDVALARLVRGWSDRGLPASLRVPASLPGRDDAGDYGWQAFIPAQPCSSTADVTRYYRRCGAWLAVMHVLGGRDFHGENLIASGAYPVPIDSEMVTAPRLARCHHLVPDTPSARAFEHTVLETGFLPWQRAGRGGHDVSGLGA